MGEAVGQRHRAPWPPEFGIVALGRMIMQHDEIADQGEFKFGLGVEFIDFRLESGSK